MGSRRQRVPMDDGEIVPVWRGRGEHVGLVGGGCRSGVGFGSLSRGVGAGTSLRHRSNCLVPLTNRWGQEVRVCLVILNEAHWDDGDARGLWEFLN